MADSIRCLTRQATLSALRVLAVGTYLTAVIGARYSRLL